MGEINYVTVGSSFKLNNIKNKRKIFFAPGWNPMIDKKGNIFSKRKGCFKCKIYWKYKTTKSK